MSYQDYRESELPKELVFAVSKLTGAKRSRVIISPSTNNVLQSGGSLCTFNLSQGVYDLSTVSIVGQFIISTQNTSNVEVQYINPASHHLVSQEIFSINGGVVLSGSQQQYSHISKEAFYRAQVDQSYLNSHTLEGLNGMFVPPTGYANFGSNLLANAVSSSSPVPFVLNQLSCCRTYRMYDSTIFGAGAITIRPSGLNVIKGTNLVTRNCKWQVTDLECQVDVLSSLPDEYLNLTRQLVAEKKQMKINFCNEIGSIINYSSSALMNVSTQSLDAIMVVPLNDETAFVSANTELVAPPFRFKWANADTTNTILSQPQFAIKVGQMLVPETPYRYLYSLANGTAESLHGDSVVSAKHLLFVNNCDNTGLLTFSNAGYPNFNGVMYQALSATRSPGWGYEQVISGISTYGQNVVAEIKSSLANAPSKLFVVAMTTATAIFDPMSGSVSVIQ